MEDAHGLWKITLRINLDVVINFGWCIIWWSRPEAATHFSVKLLRHFGGESWFYRRKRKLPQSRCRGISLDNSLLWWLGKPNKFLKMEEKLIHLCWRILILRIEKEGREKNITNCQEYTYPFEGYWIKMCWIFHKTLLLSSDLLFHKLMNPHNHVL